MSAWLCCLGQGKLCLFWLVKIQGLVSMGFKILQTRTECGSQQSWGPGQLCSWGDTFLVGQVRPRLLQPESCRRSLCLGGHTSVTHALEPHISFYLAAGTQAQRASGCLQSPCMLGCLLPPGGENYGQAPGPWAAWGMGMDVGRTGHPTVPHTPSHPKSSIF